MAERLTEVGMFIDTPVYKIKNGKKGEAVDKLAKLEDILEKYGIESVELLEHIIKKGIVINSTIEDFAKEEYDKMKQDRDTWQKACELACKWFKQTGFIGDQTEVDYYYQQAKKEGEQK